MSRQVVAVSAATKGQRNQQKRCPHAHGNCQLARLRRALRTIIVVTMEMRWVEPDACDRAVLRRLAGDAGLPAALAAVLVRRGILPGNGLEDFLDPRLSALSAPEELEGAAGAAEMLEQALRGKRRIVLYGDYDVDGVASLAFFSRVLSALGGQVACFLPTRSAEGYGLTPDGIARCCEETRPDVVVAVDCGTNSVAEIAWLVDRGIPALVLDHHEPQAERPAAHVVNPKLGEGPLRDLCSAGVVFKVLHALLKRTPEPSVDLRHYLDLVALATVADMVPLRGENRTLVRRGLWQLIRTRWPGLRALMDSASVSAVPRGQDIGFRLGPRINASGRLGSAHDSLELLTTDDPRTARAAAARLESRNRERQAVEKSVAGEAENWIDEHFDPMRHASIVAGGKNWHQGVLGIVAARVMRRHHRPTIVVGFDEEGCGRGSGRSVDGFSLVEALSVCGTLLDAYGGHELAAGLSVHESRFHEFRESFEHFAATRSDQGWMTPTLNLDGQLSLEDVGPAFLEAQERLEPFGNGNAQPVFCARGLSPAAEPRIYKDKHLGLRFRTGAGILSAIAFHGADIELPRPPWDMAFRVERNTYQGRDEAQLHIVAIRAAA
jgi:single-stranded-DNA-specific exonuclease